MIRIWATILILPFTLLAYDRVDLELLKLAKFNLVNGELKNAKLFLDKMENSIELRAIKNRYLATIAFIEGDYLTSDKYLRNSDFDGPVANTQVCLLKVLNSLALENLKQLDYDFKTCKELTFNYSKNRHLWLEYVVNAKLARKNPFTSDSQETLKWIFQDVELTRIWLKKNIFFNTEKKSIEYLTAFPSSTFRRKDIRELIGLSYFRLGDQASAFKYIEDLDTPTAENIKGNIELRNKKYELAYGHFQLAIKYKENSKNALERLIPLSWIMGKWQDGLNFLDKEIGQNTDQSKKLALQTAFLLQLEDLEAARTNLSILNKRYRGSVPKEVLRMDTYLSLRLSQTKELKNNASLACKKFDGLNCWIFLQMFLWEDLGEVLKNNQDTITDSSITLESLKSEKNIEPLQENELVDQTLVEELDSALVQIKEK